MVKRCKMRDYRCRPPKYAQAEADRMIGDKKVWRLAPNGRWAPDNGEPGLAFAAGVMHYYPEVICGCFGNDNCVSRRSAAKCLEQFSTANGRMVRATRVRPRVDDGQEK